VGFGIELLTKKPAQWATLAIFSTSVLLSIISYEAFEKHFLQLKEVWFQKHVSKVQNQGLILDHELTY